MARKYSEYVDPLQEKANKHIQRAMTKWKKENPEPPTIREYLRAKFPDKFK